MDATRKEIIMAAAARGEIPDLNPITREEILLYRIAEKIKNGGNGDQSGGGMSTTAANLLIEILESAVYNTNVSGKIASLKEALASGGSSGGDNTGGETPDVPDEPVVTDDITVSDGVMTIVTVGSAITVSDGVMTIA